MSKINLKLKSYDELIFEITTLNTNKYLLEQKVNKYTEVLDKIKEYLWDNTNFETVYHYDKDITVGKIRAELEELLEEIE